MSFFDLKDVEFQVIDNVVDTSTAPKSLLCAVQDYVAALRDPGTVGKTARERRTPGLRPVVFLFLSDSEQALIGAKQKTPCRLARGSPFS